MVNGRTGYNIGLDASMLAVGFGGQERSEFAGQIFQQLFTKVSLIYTIHTTIRILMLLHKSIYAKGESELCGNLLAAFILHSF